jgi:hypothetical protein
VVGKLSKEESIHLTIDLWSNHQMRSFFGIITATTYQTSGYWSGQSLPAVMTLEGTLAKTLYIGMKQQ